MHIREPNDFAEVRNQRRSRLRRQKTKRALIGGVCVAVILAVLGSASYLRPVPAVAAKVTKPTVSAQSVAMAWPAQGQAAMGVQGQGVLAATPSQQPVPTASVAKVMLSLAVLKKYPLQKGQPGPTITVTADDVRVYDRYVAEGGSNVRVVAGEQLTEYQALQAVLLPSANNVADMLAVWAYGSMDAYHVAANQLAQGIGMTQSKFTGDASGLQPETVSTAHDLVLLGQAALDQPVLKEIVAQQTAVIPVAGEITNTNFLLGSNNIIGIKTGNSDQAGGVYLFAATHKLSNGKEITAVGAVMAAPSLFQAVSAAPPLLNSFYKGFVALSALPSGTNVARYTAPWGAQAIAATTEDLKVLGWQGSKPTITIKTSPLKAPAPAGTNVGTASAQTPYGTASVPVTTQTAFAAPSWQWRVVRR